MKPQTKKMPASAKIAPEVSAGEPALLRTRASPYLRMNVSLGILAAIAFVAALYLARAFFVPLLIGILASYALRPVVEWLQAHRIPRPLGAALVLLALVGGLFWIAFSLSDNAAAMIDKLPESARNLRQHLSEIRTSPSTLQNMQETAKQIEGAADDALKQPGESVAEVPANKPSTELHDYVFAQAGSMAVTAGQAIVVLFITYFLLASGAHFRRKLVEFVGPAMSRQKDTVRILDEADLQIQRYLLSMLVTSGIVGVVIWLAFGALGMEQPGVWGVAGFVLQFIPYLGPLSLAFAGGLAGFLQSGSLLHGLYVTGVSLLVTSTVGIGFATWLQSKFAHVNPAMLFISLLFFGWLWGAWGLLLGAPLVAIAKVICDRIESLKPIGELLGK